MAPEKLLDEDFRPLFNFENHVSKQTSPVNKVKTDDTGTNFNFPVVPDSVGPVESIPSYLA